MPKKPKNSPRQAETVRVETGRGIDASSVGNRVGSVLVVQGAEVDLGKHVLCSEPITIGRDEGADLALNDGSISRAHCRVERSDSGAYMVVDLGSTNGTSVNGVRVDGRVSLQPGDKIFLGASVVRFGYSDVVDVEYQSKVDELVSTDALTGLGSKRAYDALFQSEAQRARAEDTFLSVIVMDLDGLKQINDSHGHEMGSFAIAETGRLIRDVMQPHGHLCRYGGDEMVGCFPGLDPLRAKELGERLRVRVENHAFVRDGIELKPTVSIGVATYPVHAADTDELFAIADRALYKAKQAGKNRVVVAPIRQL